MRALIWTLGAAYILGVGLGAKPETDSDRDETNKGAPEPPVIGIDLGTTYSCVAVMKNAAVEIIPNATGDRIVPSYVAYIDGAWIVGQEAKDLALLHPKSVIFDVKRLMGRYYNDPVVQSDKKLLPYDIVNNAGNAAVMIENNGVTTMRTPEEISAQILIHMKKIADAFLGIPVKNVVVTVPAYFNDRQRAATTDAARIAKLELIRIISEPTAAALAYGLGLGKSEKTVLVYDLGGGTFDVSVLTIDAGVFEVNATNGDNHLGGEDFDQRLIEHCLTVFRKEHRVDTKPKPIAMGRLRRAVEQAKRELSTKRESTIEIENFVDNTTLSITLTRTEFEKMNMDLFNKTMKPIKDVLSDARLTTKDINDVVLVGGSTRIPKIQHMIKEFFGKEPSRGINPDEAVAYGAAVQGALLCKQVADQDIVLLDVIPLSLGIETVGGIMTMLIPRNTIIPTKKTQIFSTSANNQESVLIQVYQGESESTARNFLVESFSLTGIPPAPQGVPQIEVTFQVDANGTVKVEAVDKATKKKNSISIDPKKSRLSQEKVEEMIRDAELHAEEDKAMVERTTARIALDSYISSVSRTLEYKDKMEDPMSQSDLDTIQSAITQAKTWLDENKDDSSLTASHFHDKMRELEETCSPIISKLYGASGHRDYGQGGEYSGYEEL